MAGVAGNIVQQEEDAYIDIEEAIEANLDNLESRTQQRQNHLANQRKSDHGNGPELQMTNSPVLSKRQTATHTKLSSKPDLRRQ